MSLHAAGLATIAVGLVATAASLASAAGDDVALKRSADRGRQLYELDRATRVSADELKRLIPDPGAAGIAGSVVEEKNDGLQVIYYRMDGDMLRAVFSTEVRGGAVATRRVFAPADGLTLDAIESHMVRAREVAIAAAGARREIPCTSAPFNTVVLPPGTAEEPVAVYLLTTQTKADEYPLGGHYEIDVAADGRVVSSRAFTKSCVNLGPPPLPPDSRPVGPYVTHLLDPTPTEIHVYFSLWMAQPMYVGTSPNRVWVVEGDRIRLVKSDPAK